MTRCRFAGVILMMAGMVATGCEDQTTVPPEALEQAKQASETPREPALPTAEDLMSGRRTQIALSPLPLTLEVPRGWSKLGDNNPAGIKVSSAGLNILQGYTPSGSVQIQLTARPILKEEELERILEAGKKEMAEKPEQIVKFELRPLGSVKVLERQRVGQPGPLTLQDEQGREHTSMESSFNWTISVLVPNEGAYQDYQLSFIDLTRSHYEKESAFLNGIMSTLRYAGDALSGSPTPPTGSTAPATQP